MKHRNSVPASFVSMNAETHPIYKFAILQNIAFFAVFILETPSFSKKKKKKTETNNIFFQKTLA